MLLKALIAKGFADLKLQIFSAIHFSCVTPVGWLRHPTNYRDVASYVSTSFIRLGCFQI